MQALMMCPAHPYTSSWIISRQTGRALQAKMPLGPPANILLFS